MQNTKYQIQHTIRYWLPVVLWAGLIFYLSSLPSLETGFPEAADFYLRKAAHAAVYLILTLLVFRALRTAHGLQTKKAVAFAMLLAFLYAVSDEAHQRFIPGRQGRARDVAVDALGIAATAVIPVLGRRQRLF